jgi:Mg/Co/Ni transporter MgtE
MIKHQHLPECVYKYREVNNFSLKKLDEGTVWLTSPSKYNDPYDCAATMSYSELVKGTPRADLERLIQGSKVQSVLSPDEIEEALSASDPAMEVVRKILTKNQSVPNDKIDDMIKTLKEAQDHVMAPHIENPPINQSPRQAVHRRSFWSARLM